LATSSDLRHGTRSEVIFNPLLMYAIELAGVTGRAPRVCHVGTAMGDQRFYQAWFTEAGRLAGVDVSHLNLFPMPNVNDLTALLLAQDVVWVGGGNVANLLALWKLHGLDQGFREAWEAGVVLTGFSAGSVCWHAAGITDSFGPDLRLLADGLGFLPWSNCVHYDSQPRRRGLYHDLVGDGKIPDGYAIDDGVGLLYRGSDMVEALTDIRGRAAYRVIRDTDHAREERIEPRALPGAE
jgi:peptidase E